MRAPAPKSTAGAVSALPFQYAGVLEPLPLHPQRGQTKRSRTSRSGAGKHARSVKQRGHKKSRSCPTTEGALPSPDLFLIEDRLMSMTIHDWRAEIDTIDSELLRLLNRRAQLAIEIGAIKRRDAAPFYDPSRERQVLVRASTTNSGPLDEEAVSKIFRCIIDESRRVEEVTSEPALPYLETVSTARGSEWVPD